MMFGTVDIKIRPLKFACLVDPKSSKQTRAAIRLCSSLWGGAYFPIIPIYKKMPTSWRGDQLKFGPASKVVTGYIEAFDPDILIQFSDKIPKYITKLGLEIVQPNEVWSPLKDDYSHPRFGIGIFEILSDVFREYFKYQVKYPVKVFLPKIPTQLSLFWASLFGELSSDITAIVDRDYSEPLAVEKVSNVIDRLSEVMASDGIFPRRLTQWGLTPYGGSARRNAAVFFMDATKVEDIVDFWNLRAIGMDVMPVPKQLSDNSQLHDLVANFFKNHRIPWKHNKEVCDYASIIRAGHCTMEEVQEYAKTFQLQPEPNDPSRDGFFSLQHWYPRIWDEWARDRDGANPRDILGEEEHSIDISDAKALKLHLPAIWPKFAFRKFGYGDPRCVNEVSLRFYGAEEYIAEAFPKLSGDNFNRAISGRFSMMGDWRIGRNGLVRLVKDDRIDTRDIPAAEDIMLAWIKDQGWDDPKLSTPGLLAKRIYEILEGHPKSLANEKLLGLLEHMNGGLVKKDGTPAEKTKLSNERELSSAELKERLGVGLYEYLVGRGIFKIGLRIQCPNCSRNSWFPMDNLRDQLTCPLCLSVFPAIGHVDDKSSWCYKTSGPFSVPGYADGAFAVLLAVDFFDDQLSNLHTTPILSFTAKASGKKDLEADFALLWQEAAYGENEEGVIFGESKTYGQFKKKDFDRMRFLAKTFPGAILVFSTLRKSLTHEELTAIASIAKRGRRYWKADRPINPVLVLTGAEMLAHYRPPYCWSETLQKKFGHLSGLLSICNATQQIYLNLPSWSTEWREKHEKRLQKKTKNTRKTKATKCKGE